MSAGASNVASGITTISGFVQVQPQPVTIFGFSQSGVHQISDYSGAMNVNISGGSISVNISGQFVFTSGGGSPNISGGVTVSGSVQVSGAVTVSGNVVVIASGFGAISGTQVIISGGAGNPNISGGVTTSGGHTVSGGVTVSGSVQVSGFVGVTSGTVLPAILVSGNYSALGTYSVSLSGYLTPNTTSGIGNLAGFYNPGPKICELESVSWGTFTPTTFPSSGGAAMSVLRSSGGLLSGLGVAAQPFSTANPTATASGYVISGGSIASGIIAASGVIILDQFDMNVQRRIHYGGSIGGAQRPTARSGESLLIGITVSGNPDPANTPPMLWLTMVWVEHT